MAMIVGLVVSVNNQAITLKEQVNESSASIKVQEKRRVDLIYNLVDVAEEAISQERETLTAMVGIKTNMQDGNTDRASLSIQALGKYPELKSNENYQSLMKELATTENLIAQYRENYNIQIKEYNKFIRKFPNNIILKNMEYDGFEIIEYTDYEAPSDAPQDLFN